MTKPEKLMMRVAKGGFIPADEYVSAKLRARGYQIGQVVAAVITKARNPAFHRFVHNIGTLCRQNIEEFEHLDSHQIIKRLQLESGIECDETAIKAPGLGMVMHRVPRSISFDNMDDGVFHEFARGICRWIAKEYWPSMAPEQIEDMAQGMVEEA